MQIQQYKNKSGLDLTYAVKQTKTNSDWLVLIFPFGLKVEFAKAFFDQFGDAYSLLCCESRLIFNDVEQYQPQPADFEIQQHVNDILELCTSLDIEDACLIGYCSGAGVAISLVNQYPEKFTRLLLVHGEYAMLNQSECVTQIGRDIDSILPLAGASPDNAKMIMQSLGNTNKVDTDDISGHADLNLPYSDHRYLYRYANSYLAYKTVDFAERAKHIKLKTWVLTGNKDIHTNVASSSLIHSNLSDSDMYVDEHADHYGILRHNSNTLAHINLIVSGEL
ncbi:MAG: alpha/beta hydrolase [Pseudomonadota bacterium]